MASPDAIDARRGPLSEVDAVEGADEVLMYTPSPLKRPAGSPLSSSHAAPAADGSNEAVAAGPVPALAAPLCASPGQQQRQSEWQSSGVHVHVDAPAMRALLAEWQGRNLHGEPPAGLRVMSQCALLPFSSLATFFFLALLCPFSAPNAR
jgi:hypothetical protein